MFKEGAAYFLASHCLQVIDKSVFWKRKRRKWKEMEGFWKPIWKEKRRKEKEREGKRRKGKDG